MSVGSNTPSVPKNYATEAELAEAMSIAHRLDRYELAGRIERLVALLREHGIQVPAEDARLGATGAEHLEACRVVVVAAYDVVEASERLEEALRELRALIGSGMEFVGQERWA